MSQEKIPRFNVDPSALPEPTAEVIPLDDQPVRRTGDVSPAVTTRACSEEETVAMAGRQTIAARLCDMALDGALFVLALVAAGMVLATTTSPRAAMRLVQAGPMASGETIAVGVDAGNGLTVDDEPLADAAALARRIAQRRGERGGGAQVVVTADREALFRAVAQALAAARESGADTCRLSVGAVSGKGD